MPGVSVSKDLLFQKIGKKYTDDEFDELCFQFGIELDDVSVDETTKKVMYKLDIGANRYDLLCVEGLSRAISIFLSIQPPPVYKKIENPKPIVTTVNPNVKDYRPFIVTAVMRGVTIDQAIYTSLLDLQEKLHHNLCRKRSLVAIGIHDLSKLAPPFRYSMEPPNEIKFKALNQTKEMTATELMEIYKTDLHLKPYLHIIDQFDKFPVIRDSNGVVLSMPPIINGEFSKVTVAKKPVDLFFECTATDEGKAITVLDTLVTMLSEHAARKFEVELTQVVYENDEVKIFPKMEYREEIVSVEKANSIVGVKLTAEEIAKGLTRMSLESTALTQETVKVQISPTRHDILHHCDIYEDIAISYGYDNIKINLPPTLTIAKQFPLNKLTDLLRESTASAGWTEVLPFSLCAIEDECEKLRVPRDTRMKELALIANPKTIEFQTARYTLLSGVLKTVQYNRKMPLPLKLFEIGDVVRIIEGKETDTGCVNQRNFCGLYYNKSPGFELIHGLLDRLMEQLEVKIYDKEEQKDDKKKVDESKVLVYKLVARDHPTYFEGRCADIMISEKWQENWQNVGSVGVLHPEVLAAFELSLPIAAVEFCIEPFL